MPQRLLREVEGDEMGDFFQFSRLGDAIEGTYVKQRISDSGNYGPQPVYDIRQEDGALRTVTGTFDIKSKMAKVPIGAYVKITYVNNKDVGVNRDGTPKQPMKVFRVQTDAEGDAAPPPAQTKQKPTGSDDDVPF
jgi:hypothetical protein